MVLVRSAALVALLGAAPPAAAWQIADPIHHACHERLSQTALDRVGYVRPPPSPTGDDARLADGLQHDLSGYDANLYAWSLVEGARYPDLLGAPSFDFDDLAHVHNAPTDQGEHCLRAGEQDGPGADRAAVKACRAAIERAYWDALESLDDAGLVDPDVRRPLPVHVPFAGRVDYPFSGFYAAAGRGLHTVQDSFTHTFRSPDGRRVVHVFNWVDQIRCAIEERRDGHGHERVFDDCEDHNPTNDPRVALATEASVEFLWALTEPGTEPERRERLARFLDAWVTYEAGCTVDNDYCGNEEFAWVDASGRSDEGICDGCLGCSGAAGAAEGAAWLAAAGLAWAWRRRGARAALVALVIAALPSSAWAGDPTPTGGRALGYHTEVRASLSVQNPGYGLGAAALWAWPRFEAGAFAELNPWYSVEAGRTSLGSTNLGALAHYVHPVGPSVSLRAGLGLGVAVLNEDMIGTDAGTTGVYANLRLLGAVIDLGQGVALTADGFDLALSAPQLTGWPVLYAQHRASVGLTF